jgi:pimeloyl-ACP methyl ester carboxylesterase
MNIRKSVPFTFLFLLLFASSLYAATVDDISIHSTSTGQGPKTIILVHGWTCDETTWQFQVPALSKNYRVITMDLPGHGKSGSPKDGKFSLSLFARAIEAVRIEAKADKVALAGHSMGTPVIISYARMFPQHVAALVFIDGMVAVPPNSAQFNDFADQVVGPNGLKARENMIRGMFSSATTPEIQKKILSMMLSAPEATAVGAMKAMVDPSQWKEDVFPQPILGVYTERSTIVNREYAKVHYPGMEYHEISGAGHFLMLDKQEEFNRLLLEFLDKQNL